MKKILSILLAVLLAAVLFAGCNTSNQTPSPAVSVSSQPSTQVSEAVSSAPADTSPIKVGINMELSGAVATYGQATVDGIQMAIDEINAAGGVNGRQIELVKYDNKSDSAEVTTLANKLMTQDKVVAVLGPATSGNTKAEIPVANKNMIPVISGSATTDDVTVDASGVKEYAFRICYNDSFQGTVVANFALNNLSMKNAVIIMDSSSDYGKGLDKNFKDAFTAGGGTIVSEQAYVSGDTDFNAILTAIKGQTFDFIFIPGYYNEAGLIIKQARELGINCPVLGADGFDSPTLLDLAGAAALNNVYYTNHYSSLDQDPVVQNFIKAFKEKYNADPNAFHVLGYDLGKFICDAISRAKTIDGPGIKDALASTTNFAGVTGTISIDQNHNPVKSIVIIGLKDGQPDTSVKVNP